MRDSEGHWFFMLWTKDFDGSMSQHLGVGFWMQDFEQTLLCIRDSEQLDGKCFICGILNS